ncbi:MAG: hypothetical protein PVH50_10890 [Anaerolineae bacterium]
MKYTLISTRLGAGLGVGVGVGVAVAADVAVGDGVSTVCGAHDALAADRHSVKRIGKPLLRMNYLQ